MRLSKLTVSILTLVVVITAGAFAQTAQTEDSGSITLTGSVAKKVTINVTPIGDYDSLNLMTDVSDLQVADVTEFSNVNAGYTVSLESANAQAQGTSDPFFSGGAGNDTLTYTIAYDGQAVSFNSGAAATVTDASDKTALSGTTKPLSISYSGTSVNIYEGTYSDTLTFTISAK